MRVTIDADGRTLWRDHTGTPAGACAANGSCGYDVDVIVGATGYAKACTAAQAFRVAGRGYAVVDSLFACGCRI